MQLGQGGASFSRSLSLSHPPSHFLCSGVEVGGAGLTSKKGREVEEPLSRIPGGQMSEGDSWFSSPSMAWPG